jgi:hypothetical protein
MASPYKQKVVSQEKQKQGVSMNTKTTNTIKGVFIEGIHTRSINSDMTAFRDDCIKRFLDLQSLSIGRKANLIHKDRHFSTHNPRGCVPSWY